MGTDNEHCAQELVEEDHEAEHSTQQLGRLGKDWRRDREMLNLELCTERGQKWVRKANHRGCVIASSSEVHIYIGKE